MAELVIKPYADALFNAGLELNKVNDFSKDLEFIENIFNGEERLIQILSHPQINKDDKKGYIK